MNFKQIKEFSDSIDYAHLLTPYDCEWCIDDSDIHWSDDKGVYSAYITEGVNIINDCFIANADSQQGYWTTLVLLVGKKLDYDSFCDKYENEM